MIRLKHSIFVLGILLISAVLSPETDLKEQANKLFEKEAIQCNSKITFSEKIATSIELDLKGKYQEINLPGVLDVVTELNRNGFTISDSDLKVGLQNIIKNTGLKGRWQILSNNPLVVCDTAHNAEGLKIVVNQLRR